MKEEEIYRKLLPIDELFDLYDKIGVSINTSIDFNNSIYRYDVGVNSLKLLENARFISKIDSGYEKSNKYDRGLFDRKINEYLNRVFVNDVLSLLMGKTHFVAETKRIRISRNYIPLRYMGLLMLLESLNEIQSVDKDIVLSQRLSNKIINNSIVTPEQLEKKLIHQNELGEIAEQFVMQFEKKALVEKNIDLEPIQISKIDVSAGYDILSYYSNNIEDIKYIEVKNCDNKYSFFLSQNEVEMAKATGDKYNLYLYNRVQDYVEIINNPYKKFFVDKSCDWAIEVADYKIHRL